MQRSPDASQYLDHASIGQKIFLPPNELFLQEIIHWRRYLKQPSLDPLDEGVAQHLVTDLRTLTVARNDVPLLVLSGNLQDQAEAQRWFSGALSRVAFSRFWHEKRFLEEIEVAFGGPDESPTVCGDLPTTDFRKGGLHTHQNLVENLSLTYPASGAAAWHEGEQVFVRVSTPATPTSECEAAHLEKTTYPFPVDRFATAVPFLKREIWEGGVAIQA